MINREDKLTALAFTAIVGFFATLITKATFAQRNKDADHQKYVMEHPDEYKKYKDIHYMEGLERDIHASKCSIEHLNTELTAAKKEAEKYKDQLKFFVTKEYGDLLKKENKGD